MIHKQYSPSKYKIEFPSLYLSSFLHLSSCFCLRHHHTTLPFSLQESEKPGLKLNIQKTKMMESSPITSWQIDGQTMETIADFVCLGSKIIADGDCSHKIKRHLLFGRKTMTNLDSILNSRDITLLTKVHLFKAMVFSSSYVWMWELDHKQSWAPKNWWFWTVVLEKTP